MADARVAISFRVDFTDVIRQLRDAADQLEATQARADAAPEPGPAPDFVEQYANPNLIGTETKGPDLH